MRILVIADGRSPITRNWVGDLIDSGHRVVLISSFPYEDIPGLENAYTLPICYARYAGSQIQGNDSKGKTSSVKGAFRKIVRKYRGQFQTARYWFGPITFPKYRRQLKEIMSHYVFDLVHVLRIPFEGLFAVPVLKNQKVIVSIWGNDLTLHAPKNRYMRRNTRKVLEIADGLIVDADRDIELARQWGYSSDKPIFVALTSGGLDVNKMQYLLEDYHPDSFSIPSGKIVINPRGIRPGYIRNDVFFASIPVVIASMTEEVHFLCPSMEGQPEAENWVKEFGIEANVKLLPFLSQQDLWYCFSKADVMVSPSIHDGTPNSLLESMALGAFPVVGDIESLREWVVNDHNGYLVNPESIEELSSAIIAALKNEDLRKQAKMLNRQLVIDRASRSIVRRRRDEFYNQILNQPMI